MSDDINHARRRLLGAAALSFGAAEFLMSGSAEAKPAKAVAMKAIAPLRSFGPLKQIDAGVLNVGYAEAGPPDGPPVILLHWLGPTTFTVSSMSHRCWRRAVTG